MSLHLLAFSDVQKSYRAHGNFREKPQSFFKKEGGRSARGESPAIADGAYSSRITLAPGTSHPHTSRQELCPAAPNR